MHTGSHHQGGESMLWIAGPWAQPERQNRGPGVGPGLWAWSGGWGPARAWGLAGGDWPAHAAGFKQFVLHHDMTNVQEHFPR